MIHFVLGGFGDGKTYSGMRMLRSELLNGTRGICTNLAVKVPELALYFHNHYCNANVRLVQRLRILSDEETSSFFAHRISRGGLHYDIPLPTPEQEKRGARPDWTKLRDAGCFFIIEEAHEYFGAREWLQTGRSVLAYKNQNRKFGDDIVLITPQLGEIEKAFRTCAQSYTTITNLGARKVHGIKLPGIYQAREYVKPPEAHSHPINVYRYTLDVDLANCYDTAKGVRGVQGVLADKAKKRGGVPWWLMLGLFAIVGVLFFIAPYLIGRHWMFAGFVRPSQKTSAVLAARGRSGPVSSGVGVGSSTASVTTRSANDGISPPSSKLSSPVVPPVTCLGYMWQPGGNGMAILSDGSTPTVADGDLTYVSKRFVVAYGRPYLILPGRAVSQPGSGFAFVPPLYAAGAVASPSYQDGRSPGTSVAVVGRAYMARRAPTRYSNFGGFPTGGNQLHNLPAAASATASAGQQVTSGSFNSN